MALCLEFEIRLNTIVFVLEFQKERIECSQRLERSNAEDQIRRMALGLDHESNHRKSDFQCGKKQEFKHRCG